MIVAGWFLIIASLGLLVVGLYQQPRARFAHVLGGVGFFITGCGAILQYQFAHPTMGLSVACAGIGVTFIATVIELRKKL